VKSLAIAISENWKSLAVSMISRKICCAGLDFTVSEQTGCFKKISLCDAIFAAARLRSRNRVSVNGAFKDEGPKETSLALMMTTQTRVARWYMYFQTKNTNLGKFWRVLQCKILVYFMAIWYILRLFGVFYGHLVFF
jgi:hypothetical protein